VLRTRQLAPHCRAIGLALAAVTTWILAPCQAVAQTEDVVFRAAVGVTVSGNDLTKTAAAGWGNAGAVSVQTIESNGFVEFSGNGSVMAGLGKGDTNQTYQDIEFAIYLNASTFQVYEAGNPKGTAASYVPSDKFRVEVEGSIVRYRKNGAVFYTSLVPAAFPLLFDCSLNTTGPNVVDARIGQTSYMADVAVSVSEGTLTKTGAVGWNAGAVSSRRIRSGDGSVEFTATETNKLRAAGLSNGDTDTTASDIDFAIVLKADATVEVQENGIPHGTSSYVTGDRFRIELQGGVVTYLKNSTVLYTSGVAPTYPLWADTALYDAGATLTDIVMSEISWTSTASVIASAGTLTKTGSAGWNAGAASTASITSGDGFVEFTASETNTTRACGLADSVSSYDPAQIDFAIQLLANGNMQVYESGTPRGTASAYASGDRFRVEVQYGQVVYRKNGLVFYTSQLVPPYPLKVETSFDTVGGTLREVRLGKLVWKNELGVQVWGYSLLNPSAWGWGNSGAASTVQLASGDGGVEYTATETGTIRMLGLSNGDPDRNTAIDFAIVATNGSVMVYQKGSQIGSTYGTYAIGDRLRVAVEGGVVKYRRNGTLLYTSNQPIVYPLLVDTSFFSAPTAMTEIVLLGNFTSGTLVVTDPTPSPAGGTFNTPQTVTVTCPVVGTDVHYTTDGSDPTTTSPTIACNGTLSISQTLTLKLRGWKAGWVTSNVVTTTYTMVAATPSFSPGPGTYTGAVTVTLSTITPGVTMLYTTNGVDPPGPGTLSGTTVTADRTMTIKARATRAGWTDSAVASGTYAMTMGTVATPTFAPAPGSYAGAQTVTLSSATSGATIRYTLDGSDPAFTSLIYTGPIAVASSQTVKARAYKLDWLVSGAASGTYTIGSGAAADPPLLSPPSGRYANGLRVTVTSPMAGTTIRYTTNGIDPVDTDPVVASGTTVQVERSMRLKARCWKTGLQPSGVASADYEIVGAVAAGGDHGLALRADGTVATWGMNAYGQLGDGTTTYRLTPVNVTGGLDDVIAIAAGYRHSVALKVDGTVWSWGDNGGGILGAGIADAYRTSPVQVVTSSGPLTGITAISAGLFHTMALKSDGTVWVWGQSNYGALGQGNLNTQTRAVQVPGLTGITAIVAGGWYSLALQTNGSTSGNVWGFGLNDSGQLLDGTTTNRLSPVLGSAQITLMGAGAQHTVVRKVDGTIWGAGYNLYGQLGNGTTVTPQSTLATAMNGVTGVTKISAGGHFTLVLKSSGEVWAAGWNASGSLGDGTNLDKSTPARTVVLRDTVDIAASNVVTDYYGNAVGYSVALTADGRVWTWGSNILYGLGQGGAATDSLYRPQPLANFSVADQSWPLGDPDGDGLTTKEELTLGTNPFNPDTNGDGIGDGTAVRVGVSPTSLDTDGDGLTNAVEKTKGADPLRADTDGDGVSDGADCFPLDPTRTTCPTPQPGDVTPPVITLTEPVSAVLISSMP
jgi:alpha-tubulin suppressor-like RCC1 family protein